MTEEQFWDNVFFITLNQGGTPNDAAVAANVACERRATAAEIREENREFTTKDFEAIRAASEVLDQPIDSNVGPETRILVNIELEFFACERPEYGGQIDLQDNQTIQESVYKYVQELINEGCLPFTVDVPGKS